MKIESLLGLSLVLLVASCTANVSIEDLNRKFLSYDELPDSVKVMFSEARRFSTISGSSSLLYSDSAVSCQLESIKGFASFIDSYEITCKKWAHTIEVPYGRILPFVLHENKLYIPTLYNVQNNRIRAKQSTYEVFVLPEGK